MPELVTDDHLGGFVPGGDKATWYPALWQWFVRDCGVHFVLDVGCGDGVALRYFRDLDCNVVGIDGVEQIDRDIVRHDFNDGPWLHPLNVNFDLCWCCEFVEHVEERYMPNYLEAFTLARYVLMTHAEPDSKDTTMFIVKQRTIGKERWRPSASASIRC